LWRTVSREKDFTLEQGKSVNSLPHVEEVVAETTCDELTATSTARTPVPLWGGQGGGREIPSEVEPWKKAGVGGRCFKI